MFGDIVLVLVIDCSMAAVRVTEAAVGTGAGAGTGTGISSAGIAVVEALVAGNMTCSGRIAADAGFWIIAVGVNGMSRDPEETVLPTFLPTCSFSEATASLIGTVREIDTSATTAGAVLVPVTDAAPACPLTLFVVAGI